jgi:dephospho-CoA kinase
MSNEELKIRINSAIMEETEAKKYCDVIIDATQSPEKVLTEVLKIIKK